MKFAQELRRDEQPELLELYKKLKKSLKIFEGPADARSMVEPDASSDSEGEADRSPPRGAGAGDGAAAAAGGSAAVPAAPAAQQQPGAAQAAGGAAPGAAQPDAAAPRPDPGQEARFTALVEQCVQQLNDDYLSREEMLVIKADLAQSAAYFAASQEELSAAYTGMVNLHGELVLLCHWSMTAYTGIVKVGGAGGRPRGLVGRRDRRRARGRRCKAFRQGSRLGEVSSRGIGAAGARGAAVPGQGHACIAQPVGRVVGSEAQGPLPAASAVGPPRVAQLAG